MSEESTIQVNFGKPMPIFPLDAVMLLPHSLLPLQIFEERYRQMVTDALDGAGQIAMAVYEDDGEDGGGAGGAGGWDELGSPRPAVRPAVCVGQIIEHQKLPDGRYVVILQGICRARILHELPASETVLYRRAMLEPVGISDADTEELRLTPHREQISSLLATPPLTDLKDSSDLLEALSGGSFPTTALLELLTLRLFPDDRFRYLMLAEGDAVRRAKMVEGEMDRLRHLLEVAAPQREVEWPKGMSWN